MKQFTHSLILYWKKNDFHFAMVFNVDSFLVKIGIPCPLLPLCYRTLSGLNLWRQHEVDNICKNKAFER